MKVSPLSSEWSLADLIVPNRIAMAPMSTNLADHRGLASTSLLAYLEQRAVGGCGMIIVESATVDYLMGNSGCSLRIDNNVCVAGLKQLVNGLHVFGTIVVAQLWHAGPRASVDGALPLSPSGTTAGLPVSRRVEYSEIKTIVRQFVEAGDRAAQAGFDAVEIHAAHGYLLHNFIDQVTNRRQDEYGGTVENRYRILAEISAGINSMHPSLPVILRLSLRDTDDFGAIASLIRDARFDAVDLRTGFSSMPHAARGTPVSAGYTLSLAQKLRPHLSMPLMTGGRLLTPKEAEQAVVENGLDAIILGRPLLADPDWARKAFSGKAVTVCRYDCEPSCYSKFKEGEPLRCVYYEEQDKVWPK
jgi:2,4-dienoyl-CoA reductase-like NADH-dependent reductase (Old Yellow Enzyme family)